VKLRPYQAEAKAAVFEKLAASRSTLVEVATGTLSRALDRWKTRLTRSGLW
jgi:hypothetical protein